MANVIGNGKDRHLVDADGDSITDEASNALKVKLVGSDTINANIGDIDVEFNGTAASVNAGTVDAGTLRVAIASDANNVNALVLNSLVPSAYDYIALTYNGSGDVATATYKTGGSGGTTVAILTLAYSGDNLTTVTKTNS